MVMLMKKQMLKIYALIFTLLLITIVTGCGEGFRTDVNKRPDDDISKAIYEAVGRKKVYYYSKRSDNPEKIVFYEYLVHDYEDENVLTDMVEAVNVVMEEKEMTVKIDLDLREKIPGGVESVASLSNYYEGENGCEQYETLQCLYISGTEHSFRRQQGSPYDKITTYINLPDIKSLIVTEKIAQQAAEEEIDWYEIWPDLEYYEVLED